MIRRLALLAATVAACASPRAASDSTAALAAPDTMKAAPGAVANLDSAATRDSIRAVDSARVALSNRPAATSRTPGPAATTRATKTPAPTPPARVKPTPRDSTIVGRDSAIRRLPGRLPGDTQTVQRIP